MPENEREWIAANQRNWEERAAIHLENRTGFYGTDRVRAGEDILHAIEAEEIGDLGGKRLLHLQCHFGLDTLCLARRGAAVTGLDFSQTAIVGARALAAELGISAEFVKGEVYDSRSLLAGSFDRIYVTWGTICWLPHMRLWAQVVASLLRRAARSTSRMLTPRLLCWRRSMAGSFRTIPGRYPCVSHWCSMTPRPIPATHEADSHSKLRMDSSSFGNRDGGDRGWSRSRVLA
jgi:hypothetical protein